jgi:hypothetical protein
MKNHWSCIKSSAKNVGQNTSEKRKECSVTESKSTRKTRIRLLQHVEKNPGHQMDYENIEIINKASNRSSPPNKS